MGKTTVRGEQITDSTVSLTIDVKDVLPVANGGSGASTLTGMLIGNGASAFTAVAAPTGTVVGTSDTQTLDNKRINPRVSSTTSASTITPNLDTADMQVNTAQAAALTVANYSGTPVDGQIWKFRIKDNGTSRAITWGTNYVDSGTGVRLAATVAGKTHTGTFVYDSVLTKLVCLAFDATGY